VEHRDAPEVPPGGSLPLRCAGRDDHLEIRMTADQTLPDTGFLRPAAPSSAAEELFAGDRQQAGYVMNLSHAWAHQPAAQQMLMDQLAQATASAGLSYRQRAVLVCASAAGLGDPHCSLAWGRRLAVEAGEEVAAAVLRGDDEGLEPGDRALARWARQLARDPSGTTPADVELLRELGMDDAQIVATTLYVALRIAFSTVNDALGARPDRQLVEAVPRSVREAVTYGRPTAAGPSAA
jgi:alkylhydroperoxidase family enzyme